MNKQTTDCPLAIISALENLVIDTATLEPLILALGAVAPYIAEPIANLSNDQQH